MKPDQMPFGQIERLRLRWTSATGTLPTTLVPGVEVQLQFSERTSQAMLRLDAEVLRVEGDGPQHEQLLADLCTRHFPRIAWVLEAAQGQDQEGHLTIQVHTFLHTLSLPPIDIGVDEKALETLGRWDRKLGANVPALNWLKEQFLLDADHDPRGFATARSETGAFALLGRTVRLDIRRTKRPDSTEGLLIERIARGRHQGGEPIALVAGAIRFVDATVAGQLRADAAAQIASLVSAGSSFLDIWSQYGAMENASALRGARRAGWLKYDHAESLPDGRWRFSLANDCTAEEAERFGQAFKEGQGLGIEAVGEVPEVLTSEMTWAEYASQPRLKDAPAPVTFEGRMEHHPRDRQVTLTRRGGEETAPPDTGALIVSLQGDKTRLKRRDDAESAIREARCPMPQLGLLLEGRPVSIPRRGAIAPMTPHVRRKAFGSRSPTPTQEDALHVALNTPDIALIQGPPGTGKTTVIVALAERLQEVWDTQGGVQGRLLLSGYQHDAVENAIQRMTVNGLPPIKFGKRSNTPDDTANPVDTLMDQWSREHSAKIRQNLPPQPNSVLQKKLAELEQGYLLAPGNLEHTASLLQQVADLVQAAVPADLCERVLVLGREFSERVRATRCGDPDRDRLVRCVRALRCEARPFADDGPRNADRLARELARAGRPHQAPASRQLLANAAHWNGDTDTPPPFLNDLATLRRTLLLELLPRHRTEDTIPQVRTDVLALLSEVRHHLERRQNTSREGADEATWKFLAALEGDPEEVKRAVISCTSVFAATCQQSARKDMSELKGSEAYDTVVVDEAARAMPLDLFIPMARAKRRIVLVGDHRQLPHILDQELERELEKALSDGQDASQRTSELLKESLFERLFKDLRQREKEDGCRRTVTLDEQYRMHPVLGQFVSDQFYKPHGEGFRSPLPASEFVHALPGHRGPASWLNVPRSDGEEAKGKSKSRPIEAQELVAELKRLMDAPEGRELTFGVISFYKEQVKTIEDEFVRVGIAARADQTSEIVAPYRELRRPNGRVSERLRSGTVDAFQGMEFDVVLLSMVRSNARGAFGHVTSPNRLCVAMSRQKRLLIVVGDAGMLHRPDAPESIRPLVGFHQLSEVRDAARV